MALVGALGSCGKDKNPGPPGPRGPGLVQVQTAADLEAAIHEGSTLVRVPQLMAWTRRMREWVPLIRTAPAATAAGCPARLQSIVRSEISKN